jgi:hypothetical protein
MFNRPSLSNAFSYAKPSNRVAADDRLSFSSAAKRSGGTETVSSVNKPGNERNVYSLRSGNVDGKLTDAEYEEIYQTIVRYSEQRIQATAITSIGSTPANKSPLSNEIHEAAVACCPKRFNPRTSSRTIATSPKRDFDTCTRDLFVVLGMDDLTGLELGESYEAFVARQLC